MDVKQWICRKAAKPHKNPFDNWSSFNYIDEKSANSISYAVFEKRNAVHSPKYKNSSIKGNILIFQPQSAYSDF